MSAAKRRQQAINRRRWAAELRGIEFVDHPRPVRPARPRLVLIPGGKGKAASSPWRLRLWESRHPQPVEDETVESAAAAAVKS